MKGGLKSALQLSGTCPICLTDNVELVEHHWYEDSSHMIGHIRLICRACNGKLRTANGVNNHVFASWDEQVEYVKNYAMRIRTIRLPIYLDKYIVTLAQKRQCSVSALIVNILRKKSTPH